MRIGYSVRNNHLRNLDRSYQIVKSKSEYESLSLHQLGEIFSHNLRVLRYILDFNASHDLPVYELFSEMLPFPSESKSVVENFPQNECIFELIQEIRNFISENNVRLVIAPTLWNSILSPKPSSYENALRSIQSAANLLDLLGLPASYEAPIIISLNTNTKDIESKCQKFAEIVATLPSNIKDRLVLRNDQKITRWTVHDLTDHLQAYVHIPIIMDTLFHLENPDGSTIEEALEAAYGTWAGYVPVYFYSERKLENEWINEKLKNKITSNSRSFLVYNEPPSYDRDIDCIIKARGHEKAAIHARNKHWRWS